MRWRPALSMGVIVALVVGVWAALSSGNDSPPETTTSTAAPTSTTTSTPATTSTMAPTTTSSPATTATTTDAEARLEEVRQILEDLYFRWFDAIYHNDEEAVLQVIATEERLISFREATQNHGYPSAPEPESVQLRDVEVLRDTPECLVVYGTLDLTEWLGDNMTSAGVDVLWPYDDGWRRATLWTHPGDLWETDCEASRDDELP